MIIKYNAHSFFIPVGIIRKKLGIHRTSCFFISNGKFPVSIDICCLNFLAGFLDLDKAEAFALLVRELDKVKGMAGIMVKDGLYAHPCALGKVLIKLARN